MSRRADRITALLRDAFAPSLLEVHDDSSDHIGHSGWRPEGETHYSVRLVSQAFAGKNRVARARAVHAVLDQEFQGGLHALSLTLEAPGERAA